MSDFYQARPGPFLNPPWNQLNRSIIRNFQEPVMKYETTVDDLVETTTEGSPVFQSILFAKPEDRVNQETAHTPSFFRDLNLDQIVEGITVGKAGYDLKPFFCTPLGDIDAIAYRHEVFQDLEAAGLLKSVRSFGAKMGTMREHLTTVGKLYYQYQKRRCFLDALETYCEAIRSFAQELSPISLRSRGFTGFRSYLRTYVESEPFRLLALNVQKLNTDLSSIIYTVNVRLGGFTVRRYEDQADYSTEVQETFEKFKQGAVKDYRVDFENRLPMNHIEAKILEFVVRLYPDIFNSLDEFCDRNADYVDKTIERFDREIQFYLAYLEYCESIERTGLKFCYPDISTRSKEVYNHEGFDLALAHHLAINNARTVCNDFYLKDPERIFVVTGPNQGGKTTFARAFGQLHYFASIGCLVPGTEARVFLFDKILTHFEKQENMANLRGKLQDDVVRIHEILKQTTPNSLILMNEIFTSTTLRDALFLSKKVIEKIIQQDAVCVWVTFVDELASFSQQVVSLVSMVDPQDPTIRTFKVLRRPAAGLSYALSLAEKHGLTFEQLKARIEP
jgi:DNA mismatch repair protein MutS